MILEVPGCSGLARVVRHAREARRLRIEIPGLRGDARVGRKLERELLASDLGVRAVRADWRTGRALIQYEAGAALLTTLRETPLATSRETREPRGARAARGLEPQPIAAWHALTAAEVLDRFGVDRNGLTSDGVKELRARYGVNAIEEHKPRSRAALLLSQIDNLPAYLLMGSSAISLLSRDILDAGAILSAVGLDAAIGYRVERRNQGLLEAWAKLEAGEARVLRDGGIQHIPAADLVLGDVLLLRADELVPADARIVDAHRLACNEAILTGESELRPKSAEAVAEDANLAERSSLLHAGTTVATGRARAVVVAIGSETAASRIRRLTEAVEPPPTPFERRLERLGNQLAIGGAGAGAASIAASAFRGRSFRDSVRTAVALAVAAIPEGLPVVATAALVRSMERMRERGMIVRRLVSAETLGGVTVVCADKTGTLTRNEMSLEVVDLGHGALAVSEIRADIDKLFEDPAALTLAAAVLNSDLELHGRRQGLAVSGSPTEKALVAAAEACGLDVRELHQRYRRRLLRGRDQSIQYVVSCHETPDRGSVSFIKGAPGQVLELCERDLQGPLDAERRRELRERNRHLAGQGFRVLAVAWRVDEERNDRDLDHGFTLLGLLGLRDPLREGAAETVQAAARAGIRTVIVTGDQAATAGAIARAVGLAGEVVEGRELVARLETNGPQALQRLRGVAAVARVTPTEKATLVRSLREAGEVVAMAGDGLNDAPAIRAADVGIAIGRRSSDVSREAADIVLASEDLASVLLAVGEGRVVQDNLRRTLRYLLATNLSESIFVIGSSLLGAPDPLNPMRLLWLNLVTDSLPAMALALEPADGDVLSRPPAPPSAPLIEPEVRRQIVRDALGLVALASGSMLVGGSVAAFNALVGAQLGYAFLCRPTGVAPTGQFFELINATAAVHLAGMLFPPLRRLLRLPAGWSPVELGAFGAGLLIPYTRSQAGRDLVIVRRGRPQDKDNKSCGSTSAPS